jgi:protein transport protein SEC31
MDFVVACDLMLLKLSFPDFSIIICHFQNQDGFEMNGIDKESATKIPYKLETSGAEGLICEALLTGNITAAVELCMESGRSTDAIILASLGGSDLLARTQYRYLKGNESFISNLISAMVMADWSGVISQCTIDSWKEALVAALTHSQEQSPLLCERLGERLQIESGGDQAIVKNSILCYICAGNIERIVDAWSAINGPEASEDSEKLQELVEIVVLLNKAMERQGKNVAVYGKYAELLSKYASLLAAQGSLDMALTYVGTSQDDTNIIELRERLYHALGHKQQQPQQVKFQQGSYHNTAPRLSHPRASMSSNSGMPLFQPAAVPFQPAPMAFQAAPSSFNTGLPNAGSGLSNHFDANPAMSNPWAQPPQNAPITKPPAMMNPLDNLQQPPRPSSVSSVGSASQPGAASLPKPKRLLDPSVQSGPNYGQVPAPSQMYGAQPVFNTNPIQQVSAPFAPQPFASQPMQPSMGWDQPQTQQQNFGGYQNNNGMNGNNNSLPPPPQSQMMRNPTPPPGWNDPPEFKTKSQVRNFSSSLTSCDGYVFIFFPLKTIFRRSVYISCYHETRHVSRTCWHEKVASKARRWLS